ncbi:unnamed protein product [Chrysoparadoxa australica]
MVTCHLLLLGGAALLAQAEAFVGPSSGLARVKHVESKLARRPRVSLPLMSSVVGDARTASKGKTDPTEEMAKLSRPQLQAVASKGFKELFGSPSGLDKPVSCFAPGRVNLQGDHTDYQLGYVMPMALERGTVIYGVGKLVSSTDPAAGLCKVASYNQGGAVVEFTADSTLEPGEPHWANYVKGVVAQYIKALPADLSLSFSAFLVGTVPLGGGVSSSASLSVATAALLETILEPVEKPDPLTRAHRCRAAEHEFLNTPCGIMDQFVTSCAEPGCAMLLDCRSEVPSSVLMDDPDLAVVVTNSNVVHSLGERGSQYPVRVAQCNAAVEALQGAYPDAGIESLRDATVKQVESLEGKISDVIFKRARHVVSENDRCLKTAEALKAKDYTTAGRQMLASHRSLATDYEVSCTELDTLVTLAMQVEGVYGSRLTGAGFGGCTVTMVRKDCVDDLISHLKRYYKGLAGVDCSCFVTQAGVGAHVMEPN